MSEKSYREQSKLDWAPIGEIHPEQLALGCFQRMAISLESLAVNWASIQRENVNYQTQVRDLREKLVKSQRKAHLLGLENKRLKKRLDGQ